MYLMVEKPDEVLTIKELSTYLKIPRSTPYKLVREGKISSRKVGCHWRFRKEAFDRWLDNTWAEESKLADLEARGAAQAKNG